MIAMGLPCLILIVSPLTFKESVFLVTWRWFYIIQRSFGEVVRENIPSEIETATLHGLKSQS